MPRFVVRCRISLLGEPLEATVLIDDPLKQSGDGISVERPVVLTTRVLQDRSFPGRLVGVETDRFLESTQLERALRARIQPLDDLSVEFVDLPAALIHSCRDGRIDRISVG